MVKKNIKSIFKFLSISVIFMAILAALPFVIYLKVLPWAVSNPKVIDYVETTAAKALGVDVYIEQPVLKTSLSSNLSFGVKKVNLSQKNK